MASRWVALLLLLLPVAGRASFLDNFSPEFRSAIDSAMEQQTAAGRREGLLKAMHNAKDEEVFFVIPMLFPPPTLDKVKEAGVCLSEIDASLGDVKAYLSTPTQEQAAFPSANSARIRAHTDALITCVCQYYKDGTLAIPPQQPNNSFKPTPLRGSA